MPTPRQKPFAPSGHASGPRSPAPRARRSSGRWKSGWLNSTRGSSKSMRAPVSNPAGGAARADWLASCRLWRAPIGRGKPPALTPEERRRQTSNAVAAVVAAVVEVAAAVLVLAIDRSRVRSRRRSRARDDLSVAARRDPPGEPPHPDPPGETPHPDPHGEPPHPDPPPRGGRVTSQGLLQATRAIPTADGGGGVGGVDAARDRTVRRQVAARRVAARRPINRPGRPNSPE